MFPHMNLLPVRIAKTSILREIVHGVTNITACAYLVTVAIMYT